VVNKLKLRTIDYETIQTERRMKPTISVQHADKQDKDIVAKPLTPLAGVIFTAGNVVCDEQGFIVMVSNGYVSRSEDYFAGTIINNTDWCSYNSIGEHRVAWKRQEFEQFHGTITINV
jgi:hypothetical protein